MASREGSPSPLSPPGTLAALLPSPLIWSLRQGDQVLEEHVVPCGVYRGHPRVHVQPNTAPCLQKPHVCPREQGKHGVPVQHADGGHGRWGHLPAGPVGWEAVVVERLLQAQRAW